MGWVGNSWTARLFANFAVCGWRDTNLRENNIQV